MKKNLPVQGNKKREVPGLPHRVLNHPSFPKPMQVAVGKGRNRFVKIPDIKFITRLFPGNHVVDLKSRTCLQGNPLNVMGIDHGMKFGAHRNHGRVPENIHHGHVLFFGSIHCIGLQFNHGFAAADHRNAGIFDVHNDVSAHRATEKRKFIHKALLF